MNASFNDGLTSKRRNCQIQFQRDKLEIQYLDDTNRSKISTWEISGIHKVDVRTTSCTLKYGEYPPEVLQLNSQNDLDFIIDRYPEAIFHKSTYNTFVSFGWKGLLVAISTVILFSIFFFMYGAPALAEVFARAMPQEYETYIGENVQATYLKYLEVDSASSGMMQQFFEELDYQSDYHIQIAVVNSDIANAFALPGGFIVVYSGILEIMEEEEELAALLAHEVSHINGRHSLRTISRSLSTYLLISILTGDMGGFSSVIIENSATLSDLSFSKSLEKEADLLGLDLMKNAGINPQGMVNLFKRFENMEKLMLKSTITIDTVSTEATTDSDSLENWQVALSTAEQMLSTHPSPNKRIEYLEQELKMSAVNDYQDRTSLQKLFEDLKAQ